MDHKSERGYSLIGVLLIITIVAIVGVSLAGITLQSVKTSTKERDNQAVYYIAEAGMNYLTKEIQDKVLKIYNDENVKTKEDFIEKIKNVEIDNTELTNFESINNNVVFAEINMNYINDASFELISTGFIGNEKRAVNRVIDVEWLEKYEENKGGDYKLPPFAVFTNGQFTMDGGGEIIGDIGTIVDTIGAINFPGGGPTLEGKIYVPNGNEQIVNQAHYLNYTIDTIDPSYSIPELPEFPIIPTNYVKLPDTLAYSGESSTYVIQNNNLNIINWITKNYVLKLDDNVQFNQINLEQNNTLNIDLNGEDRSVVVNHLNMKNGHIKIIGDNTLTIYVRDKITMGAGSTLNDSNNIENLNIFYAGADSISLSGGQKIYGSLYAKQANLSLSAGSLIYGNIFTGGSEISMDGGSDVSSQLILAPNANFQLSAGGTIHGMIISKTFSSTGGGKVILDEPFTLQGPISPSALGVQNSEGGSEPPNPGTGNNVTETGNQVQFTKSKIKEVTVN